MSKMHGIKAEKDIMPNVEDARTRCIEAMLGKSMYTLDNADRVLYEHFNLH